jgi:hypothetical protein
MSDDHASRRALPLILIRGFGGVGVEDEKRIAYQGFNDGTVYPQKRGENYIYEGLILRFMKSSWQYQDATNVVGYYSGAVEVETRDLPPDLTARFDKNYFTGHRIIIDPAMALNLVRSAGDPCKTLWVFRYYDLNDRRFSTYGEALVRLIGFLRDLAAGNEKNEPKPKVNILAHSMGGLLVREAVQVTYPGMGERAGDHINKIVTLGTPHQGIAFQFLQDWIKLDAEQELEHFNPAFQADEARDQRKGRYKDTKNNAAYVYFKEHFPPDRLLTVVGTNYRSYSVGVSSWLNRVFSVTGEGGPAYNRSDGLVKQAYAQIPGAPRTFVHKCHGGYDSLVTSREAYEIATRFFFGNVRARLRLISANASAAATGSARASTSFRGGHQATARRFRAVPPESRSGELLWPVPDDGSVGLEGGVRLGRSGPPVDMGGISGHQQARARSRAGQCHGHGAATGRVCRGARHVRGRLFGQRHFPQAVLPPRRP